MTKKPGTLNDDSKSVTSNEPKIGSRMPDGTIYAGLLPDTGTPLYTTPEDSPFATSFHNAKKYARALKPHSHQDWRLPTNGEINVLFNNRATTGGFQERPKDVEFDFMYWYSSGTKNYEGSVWAQRLIDEFQHGYDTSRLAPFRCVR